MPFISKPLPAGLHFVATPIGAARDITLRALDVLASADVIAAEDTRTLRRLLDLHGVPLGGRRLIAYHDHNGAEVRPRLIGMMRDGLTLAYASEAGTPLVADPGYALMRAAINAGLPVTSAPGPSAVIAALTIAGLPTDRFFFAGFAPNAEGARKTFLNGLRDVPGTLVIYESPKRVGKLLANCVQCLGEEREAAICRELTKRYEEVARGSLAALADRFGERSVKGEIVVLIDRNRADPADAETMEDALQKAMTTMSVRDAAATVAEALSLPRRTVYQAALDMEKTK